MDDIVVTPRVVIPGGELAIAFSRSGGPGGQNVNKVASKVDLRVDLDRIEGLSDEASARLRALAEGRLDGEGRLLVVSQRTRDQHRNLEDAREKVRALVRRAMIRPRTRRPTRVTAAAKARRIAEKKRRGAHKRGRGTVRADEE